MSQLLIERLTWGQANIQIENKESQGRKRLYMKGVFIEGERENHNGRVYPGTEIRRAVDDIRRRLDQDETIWGEADHPEELTINLDRISHNICEMNMEGNNGVGKLCIVEGTPMGQLVKGLIEHGGKLGVSSRGTGDVGPDGRVSGFDIVTVDIVANPSAPGAYPKPIVESLMQLGKHTARDILNLTNESIHDPRAQQFLKRELLRVMDDIFANK